MTPEQRARLERMSHDLLSPANREAVAAALAHLDALEARVEALKANGLDLDVLAKAYGWTYDIHGGIAGLVAGDQCYEPTGIVVEHVKELQAEREALAAEVERLKEDAQEDAALRARLSALLTGVAHAAKGEPEPLSQHSWHDLPERVAELQIAKTEIQARADALAAERDELKAQKKDGAYEERNRVVAALACCFPAFRAKTAIEGWSENWHGCVYIDLPTGQASWHYHDSQAHLFAHVPERPTTWDGHTTEEKYQRLQRMCDARFALTPSAAPGEDA